MIDTTKLSIQLIELGETSVKLELERVYYDYIKIVCKVIQGPFSGAFTFTIDERELDYYLVELEKIDKNIEGKVAIFDDDYEASISLDQDIKGHLKIKIFLGKWEHDTHAEFYIESDQTVLTKLLTFLTSVKGRIQKKHFGMDCLDT
ncbi:MAG: hypothetical protein HUJ84_05095 [Veillonella sp.]|nr:hypothetical protein [Veillonella sp.]